MLLELLRRHGGLVVAGIAGLVVGALFGTTFGRLTAAPPAPRVEVHQVEVAKQETEASTTAAAVTSSERAEVHRVVVHRERIFLPDGTRIEREVETNAIDLTARNGSLTTTVQLQREATERRTDTHVSVTAAPNWRIGALVGLDVLHLPRDRLELVRQVTWGARVERRVLGPIWVGAWGLNTGVAGVSLSAEF